jgi:hypothetical protein
MASYPYQILTYRAGVIVNRRAARSRAAAELVFREAVEAAQRTVVVQRVPRRVEVQHGGAVIEYADVAVSGP